MRSMFLTVALLAVTACAEDTAPDPTPAADGGDVYNKIDPVVDPLANQAEAVEEQWLWSEVDGGPTLSFGQPDTEGTFSIYCDGSGGIVLQRIGEVPLTGPAMIRVTAGGETGRFAARREEGARLPTLIAKVPSQDDFMAALAEGEGELRVEIDGTPPLVLPPEPRLSDLVERCGVLGA